jgi:hypothetical protein
MERTQERVAGPDRSELLAAALVVLASIAAALFLHIGAGPDSPLAGEEPPAPAPNRATVSAHGAE